MKTVWLLIEQMDYETAIVHSVYKNKPDVFLLAGLIQDDYGYAYTTNVCQKLASNLVKNNTVRMLDLYTWTLEERAVM